MNPCTYCGKSNSDPATFCASCGSRLEAGDISASTDRPPPERSAFIWILRISIGYCALSCLTLPFIGFVWLGELPLLALIQLPKVAAANWLRTHVVMETIQLLGFSRGSFSPDNILARPYGLAVAYLVPMVVIGIAGFRGFDQKRRLTTLVLLLAAAVDYVFTLVFADGRYLTIY